MTTIGPVFRALCIGAGMALFAVPQIALAQEADWPCVQRLVPKLEAGQVWSGPAAGGGRPALGLSCRSRHGG